MQTEFHPTVKYIPGGTVLSTVYVATLVTHQSLLYFYLPRDPENIQVHFSTIPVVAMVRKYKENK
jgi:hypothetical protein